VSERERELLLYLKVIKVQKPEQQENNNNNNNNNKRGGSCDSCVACLLFFVLVCCSLWVLLYRYGHGFSEIFFFVFQNSYS
jgi:hypothetical protein